MTFRDGGDHFGPKRMLFTEIELFFSSLLLLQSCYKGRRVGGGTVKLAYEFWV